MLVQVLQHIHYAKNKIYNGWDGNQIGFEGSASIVSNVSASINEAWNKFGASEKLTSIYISKKR